MSIFATSLQHLEEAEFIQLSQLVKPLPPLGLELARALTQILERFDRIWQRTLIVFPAEKLTLHQPEEEDA